MENSKLILGTVQLGLPYGINNTNGQMLKEEAFSVLNTAFNNGIHRLDTAEAYGNSHELIGEYHDLYPNNKFKIITKFPHSITDDLTFKIEEYLKELNTDKIECILFHSFKTYEENKSKIKNLNILKANNIINSIGVSVYTNKEIETTIQDGLIDIIQLPYNLLDNHSERGKLIEKAKNNGIKIQTRSCFLQGLFFMDINSKNEIVQALKNELKAINEISSTHNYRVSTLAINYCIQNQLIDNVLIGVENTQQLIDNLNDAKVKVPYEILKKFDSIKVTDFKLLNPSLWHQIQAQ